MAGYPDNQYGRGDIFPNSGDRVTNPSFRPAGRFQAAPPRNDWEDSPPRRGPEFEQGSGPSRRLNLNYSPPDSFHMRDREYGHRDEPRHHDFEGRTAERFRDSFDRGRVDRQDRFSPERNRDFDSAISNPLFENQIRQNNRFTEHHDRVPRRSRSPSPPPRRRYSRSPSLDFRHHGRSETFAVNSSVRSPRHHSRSPLRRHESSTRWSSPGRRTTSPGMPESRIPQTFTLARDIEPHTLKMVVCRVREYVNQECCILELQKNEGTRSLTAFCHVDCLFVANPFGNPYGPPIKFSDLSGGPLRIQDHIPFGTEFYLNATELEEDRDDFDFLAVTVWPRTSEPPQNPRPVPLSRLTDHLSHFMRSRNTPLSQPIYAALQDVNNINLSPSLAKVQEIFNDDYGIIEVNLTRMGQHLRYFAIFHRDDVYLPDGKRAKDHDYFRNKPLRNMVTIGQDCNLSARSITKNKGCDLVPSGLELQAIVVSLNPERIPPTAPRPTIVRGGPGTYGESSAYSPIFFEEGLMQRLNRNLSEYLTLSKTRPVDLDPRCEELDNEGTGRLPQKLGGDFAEVVELLSDQSGLLEDIPDHKWKCFFTASHSLFPNYQRFGEVFKIGQIVQVNASLIEAKKQIPYLASLVWTKDVPPSEVIGKDRQIDQPLLQKYFDINDVFDMDSARPARRNHLPDLPGPNRHQEPQRPDSRELRSALPDVIQIQEGTVFKVLDDNFGLIHYQSSLILFDVCDFWLEPFRTASKAGKSLTHLVSRGSIILFNAALVDPSSRIPYLATSVWPQDSPAFNPSNCPKPLARSKIQGQKLSIYETVVKAVSDSLPPIETQTIEQSQVMPCNKPGRVSLLLLDRNQIVAGVIAMEDRTCCFFLSDSCIGFHNSLKTGQQVFCNAITDEKFESESFGKITQLATIVAPFEMLSSLPHPKCSKRDISAKFLELITTCPQILSDPSMPKFPTLHIPSQTNFMADLDTPCILKCMFDDASGLLEASTRRDVFIYFEVSDLNVAEENIDHVDLISLLNKAQGIQVRCYASKVSDQGPIQFVAIDKAVHIMGQVPTTCTSAIMPAIVPTSAVVNREKRRRFRDAEIKFNSRDYLTWKDIIERSRGRSRKKPQVLESQVGKIRYILNDNFGLIHEEKLNVYCLFDTYDLYIRDGRSAADESLTVESILSIGDRVEFHACLVGENDTETDLVPYLVTGVWKPRTLTRDRMAPLSTESVQKVKIDVYREVVRSCRSIIAKPGSDERQRKDASFPMVSHVIEDHETTGQIHSSSSKTFAILKLKNQEKALLHTNRVWIKDKPKFGGWRALYLDYFKTLNVCARRVEGFSDFSYQVMFCHAGMNRRDPLTHRFIYPANMKNWMLPLKNSTELDQELKLYRSNV